jgi:hypothetical protein
MTGRDDGGTLAAIGVIATCLSAFGHEAFGHGGACLAVGGSISLLTATHFACAGGGIVVDAAGPLMNLILAGLAFALLRFGAPKAVAMRWFLLSLGGINLCWFAGELVSSPLVGGYDEAAIARQLDWPAIWRPIAFALGLAVYAGTIRLVARTLIDFVRQGDPPGELRRRFGIAHAAATLSFTIAGLCWMRAPFAAAVECFMTIGVAVAPLWISIGPAARATGDDRHAPVERSRIWIAAALVSFAAFVFSQARGIGPLA